MDLLQQCQAAVAQANKARTRRGRTKALAAVRSARHTLDEHRDDLTVPMALAANRSTARVNAVLNQLDELEARLTKETT